MKNKGFSLIELMIVLAIIGVLGAIGYPSYDSYMKKSRRSDVLSIDAADVNTFTLRATAVAGGPQANDTTTNHGDCTILQLTAAGAKTPAACW